MALFVAYRFVPGLGTHAAFGIRTWHALDARDRPSLLTVQQRITDGSLQLGSYLVSR